MMRGWFGLLLLLLPLNAWAAETIPLFYTRAQVIVQRAADMAQPQPKQLPWQNEPPAPPGIGLDVEVRDAKILYQQKDWYNLSSPEGGNGVLLAFATPTQAFIPPLNQYAPLDILFLDDEGVVIQIAPSIVLNELQTNIDSPQPIRAFLFLKGGTCETMAITPGDRVLYKLFRQPPTVLMAPQPPPPVPAN